MDGEGFHPYGCPQIQGPYLRRLSGGQAGQQRGHSEHDPAVESELPPQGHPIQERGGGLRHRVQDVQLGQRQDGGGEPPQHGPGQAATRLPGNLRPVGPETQDIRLLCRAFASVHTPWGPAVHPDPIPAPSHLSPDPEADRVVLAHGRGGGREEGIVQHQEPPKGSEAVHPSPCPPLDPTPIQAYQDGKLNLSPYLVIQDSFHLKCGKIDLHLDDDLVEQAHQNAGRMNIVFERVMLDVYPDQAARSGHHH